MKRGVRKAAALSREIRRRQRANLTLAPAPARTPQQYRDAFGPRPDWCDWRGWGYLMPERDGIDTPTGYLPVIDFVREYSLAELRGQAPA